MYLIFDTIVGCRLQIIAGKGGSQWIIDANRLLDFGDPYCTAEKITKTRLNYFGLLIAN